MGDKKGQRGIQSARKTDDGRFTVGMGEPLFQSVCLHQKNFFAAFFLFRFIRRNKGIGVYIPVQLNGLWI
ncbi:hypothetical protein SDC9_187972 [bioreactor metagenome]|uniref:Uncharacterized protein n=1 Tax=bioreactor metagenome TaxID=1076179 RepID=A0A645HN07_9ZZZZ